MYGTASPGTESIDSAIGGLLAASFMGVLVSLVVMTLLAILSYYVAYRVMKAAVRNGVIEAIERTGLGAATGSGGGGGSIANQQASGGLTAPPAPAYRGGAVYRV